MPRTTQKEVLAARQDPASPFLFDDMNFPIRNDVLEAVRLRRYEHTGQRLLENDAIALGLVEKLMTGWGVKRIARAMRISPHTIRAAKQALVAQGKLAPYKERVVAIMEDIVETGLGNYREALENGDVAPGQIPVGVGIVADKRSLALGEPTTISSAVAVKQENLTVDALNDWIDKLPSCKPNDSQSIDKPC